MLSAAGFTTLFQAPGSPLRDAIASDFARRACIGVAMGLSAMALVYSPVGQRSGAHMNPAMTLTWFRLGKVRGRDALGYAAAQFAGGALGVGLAAVTLGTAFENAPVSWVATLPGVTGPGVAFLAEVAISFVLMT